MSLRLAKALAAWGSPEFKAVLKQEIEALDPALLPLQQGLRLSSHVAEGGFTAILLNIAEEPGRLLVKAGLSYAGIIAGCSCTDDPTPMSEQSEYCEVLFAIDKDAAATTVTLLSE